MAQIASKATGRKAASEPTAKAAKKSAKRLAKASTKAANSPRKESQAVAIDGFDLSKKSTSELKKLKAKIDRHIESQQVSKLRDVLARMQVIADEVNMSVEQVVKACKPMRRKKKAAKLKVPIKYRNPKNSEQTWTGRGQRPVWLREAVEAGAHIDSFLVKNSHTKTTG